jgi:mannose-1-phosphate guanylyltransferase
MRTADQQGNTVDARHLGLSTTGSIIRGEDEHLIVTVGVQDLIIVHTRDATLIASKHDEEKLRQVTETLKQKGWNEYL